MGASLQPHSSNQNSLLRAGVSLTYISVAGIFIAGCLDTDSLRVEAGCSHPWKIEGQRYIPEEGASDPFLSGSEGSFCGGHRLVELNWQLQIHAFFKDVSKH